MKKQPMPVVYVAGPYRAESRAGVTLNIQAARAVGLAAIRKGWSPIIPHANTGDLDVVDPDIGDRFWLAATLELMTRCDAVLLCPGWECSAGTLAEIAEAHSQGIPVFQTCSALPLADDWGQQEQVEITAEA
ncbi:MULTISPECIES: DUF7768 domain-containing protein [Pseudomonas]|jgi:hypothetical protein|nr:MULTISPECIES: DUF4406 domain-containing protein [Pseudomonas]